MLKPLNALEFARMLFSTAPDPEVSPLVLITSYIERTQMCRSGWGTDREIRVAATLFQSDILVFSEFGPERKWSRFRPAFRNRHCTLPATGIKLHQLLLLRPTLALSSTLKPPLAQELGLAVDCHH